jgi:hypothetical protein
LCGGEDYSWASLICAGFSDIRKVVSWRNELVTRTEKGEDGEPVMVLMPRVTIVDADKISDEAAAAVAEVWQTVNGALRVKLHDKHAALVSLSRCLLRSGNGSMSGKANELGVAAAGGSAAGAGGVVAPSLLARLLFALAARGARAAVAACRRADGPSSVSGGIRAGASAVWMD